MNQAVRSSSLLFFSALLAWCQSPDRPPLADEWGYRPAEAAVVAVNPPALTWVHEKGARSYTVQFAPNAEFHGAMTISGLPWSVYTHSSVLKPGEWFWRYRILNAAGAQSAWSRTRRFRIAPDAVAFPQPTLEELKRRASHPHPRLFVRAEDAARLRAWAKGGGKQAYDRLIRRAGELLTADPTPEPKIRATIRDPQTRDHWWSNRVQTLRALQEAEVLTFLWWLTREEEYAGPAKRFTLALAAWDPDGPTNFALNCEAAKPLLHRLARAYDWAWPLFSEAERAQIRAVLLRRAQDAWKSGEVREGAGHLNQPYNSHGNRTWHKLAENAIATLGETPESDRFLHYAVTKFFAAYPVWSDDDGGWHEGLSYLSGYMGKTTWWMDTARNTLGIDPFRKPFFSKIGDYAMYSAPPGTPDLGFGDLSFRPPAQGWSFLHYFAQGAKNPYWIWWLESWKIADENPDPVLDFLWSMKEALPAKAPATLPSSKVFRGTGVAVLNSNLLDGLENVQVRFKSSPMGRWSHGHDPHNSFTLNAYGVPLLVNNVYRDWYGSPFHKVWVWHTRSQNAVLVNGAGQKEHSADLGGRITGWSFDAAFDYVGGDATASYEGKLARARRYIFFLKPDLIVMADELEAAAPSTFQWMLHAQQESKLDAAGQRLTLDRGRAGVVVDYLSEAPLKLRQWTGYEPDIDRAYLKSVNSPMIPEQWHIEAASASPAKGAWTFTVFQVFRNGQQPLEKPVAERSGARRAVRIGAAAVEIEGNTATMRRGGRSTRVTLEP